MSKIDSSLRVEQKRKFNETFEIKEFKWTDRQKDIISKILAKENHIIFLEGPAGSSKTLLGVYCGLKLIQEKRVSDFYYTRTIVESASKGIGSLPGDTLLKFKPFNLPLEDKLNELLVKPTISKLEKEERIKCIPINFMRGANISASYLLGDEMQNFSRKEIITLITRMGRFSKFVLVGDSGQSDINGRSGFKEITNVFSDEESVNMGIITVKLNKEDIMRSEEVKFIIDKLERHNLLV